MNKTIQAMMGLVALLWASTGVFTVDAREVAVVTTLGAPQRSITQPGLYGKAPWPVQQVIRYDHRARTLPIEATELLTKDKKNLVVGTYCVWRIADPQKFLEAVATNEAAELRLEDLVTSQIAGALGQVEFTELFAVDRPTGRMLSKDVLGRIQEGATARLGVEVLDVQLEHVGLPIQNEQSIYERMRAERSRIANAYRSEGEERATEIRAQADRAAAEILANASKQAAAITAEAEGEAATVRTQAYQQAPELFRLLEGVDTLEGVLRSDAVLVLDVEQSPILSEVLGP